MKNKKGEKATEEGNEKGAREVQRGGHFLEEVKGREEMKRGQKIYRKVEDKRA